MLPLIGFSTKGDIKIFEKEDTNILYDSLQYCCYCTNVSEKL